MKLLHSEKTYRLAVTGGEIIIRVFPPREQRSPLLIVKLVTMTWLWASASIHNSGFSEQPQNLKRYKSAKLGVSLEQHEENERV